MILKFKCGWDETVILARGNDSSLLAAPPSPGPHLASFLLAVLGR